MAESMIPPARPETAPQSEEADLQGGLAALHDPAELVEPLTVGTEQVRPGRGQVREQIVGVDLVGVVDGRSEETEEHEEDQYAEADHGQPVAHELTKREPPPALHGSDFTALGALR
jgi:hypothetical protein